MTAVTRRCRLPLILLALTMCSVAFADEASTARRFEHARRDEPSLIAFLKAMPKGGDLHNHFGGSIFAETALRAAIGAALFFDPATGRFERQTAPGRVPAEALLTDDVLRYRFLNAASMRGAVSGPAGGHDHFFQAFGTLDTALPALDPALHLVEVARRARLQNLQYLELMAIPARQAMEQVRSAALVTDTPEELPRRLKPLIDAYVIAAKEELDRWQREVADKGGLERPVEIRYLIAAVRTDPDARIMATWAAGLASSRTETTGVSGPHTASSRSTGGRPRPSR